MTDREIDDGAWSARLPRGVLPLVLMATVVLLNFEAGFAVGFLSDDLVQLDRARTMAWWEPITGHHVSPLLTLLYKGVLRTDLDATGWHAIAFVLHFVNALLFFRLVATTLNAGTAAGALSALLFAAAPATLEALLWPAAFCFVPLLTVLLVSLLIVLERGSMPSVLSAATLSGLQLAAFFIWDWGIVVTPILILALWTSPRAGESRLDVRRAAALLGPALLVWLAFLVYHRLAASSLGYGFFPLGPVRATALLAAAPGMNLAPNLPRPVIVALALGWIGVVGWAATRDRRLWILPAIFLALQAPWYLQGAPTGRYAYLSVGFAIAGLVAALRSVSPGRWAIPALLALGLLQAGSYVEGSQGWITATRQAESIGDELRRVADGTADDRLLVVVNLPDHATETHGQWPPPLWRNGLVVVRERSVKVFTPEYALRHEPHAPRIVERSSLLDTFPNARIIEVVRREPGAEPAHTVVSIAE